FRFYVADTQSSCRGVLVAPIIKSHESRALLQHDSYGRYRCRRVPSAIHSAGKKHALSAERAAARSIRWEFITTQGSRSGGGRMFRRRPRQPVPENLGGRSVQPAVAARGADEPTWPGNVDLHGGSAQGGSGRSWRWR
ncbi:unnamed protein product, partial [Scytosiphon promiscuus]